MPDTAYLAHPDFIQPLVDEWDLSPQRRQIVREMMLYNHALRPLEGLTPQAELLRRAVQVEHSMGLRRHGLEQQEIQEIFRQWPRKGLTRVLVDFARITLLDDGLAALKPIFLPTFEAADHSSVEAAHETRATT